MRNDPATLTPREVSVLKALQGKSPRPSRLRKQIASDLGISESNLSKIISELTARGYIRGERLELDPKTLGFGTLVFARVLFQNLEAMDAAIEILKKNPEVQEIHQMLQLGVELFLKIRIRNGELGRMQSELWALPGKAGRVEMDVVGYVVKETTDLAL